jgi:hypothetical protein
MSDRWPRFGFKQQPVVDVEAASPPAANGADPAQAEIAVGPDAQASAVHAEAMAATSAKTDAPENILTASIASTTASEAAETTKPWETPETLAASGSEATAPAATVSDEAASAEAVSAEAVSAAAVSAAAVSAEAVSEDAGSEDAAPEAEPEIAVTPIAADSGSKFLGELVRAMQAAAKDERARIDEDVERRRNESIEQVRARQASEADRMRELADGDRKSIEAWAEGETKRIQVERERRESELNKDLDVSLANHSASIDRQIEALEAAVSTYRGEVAAFFEALDREKDPVLIAQRASLRPALPDLDAIAQAPVPPEPAMVGVMGAAEPTRPGSWAAPPATSAEGSKADGIAQPVGASLGERSGVSLLETVPAERPMSWLRRARTVGEDDTNREG